MNNTDHRMWSAFYRSTYHIRKSDVNLSVGYNDKVFGANSFYTSRFPNQFEKTGTLITQASLNIPVGNSLLMPRISYRRHTDDFVLDRYNRSFYHNEHATDIYGLELQARFTSRIGLTAIGGEVTRESIESTNLGTHERDKGGLIIEHSLVPISQLFTSFSAYLYNYGEFGWKVSPDINARFQISPKLSLRGSAGWSLRIPTFTDLYYISPDNLGNPDLHAEEAKSYELGIIIKSKWNTEMNLSGFYRLSDNLIDWTRTNEVDLWQVRNVGNISTKGLDVGLDFRINEWLDSPLLQRVQLGYGWLQSNRKAGIYEWKYGFGYLQHQISTKVYMILPLKIRSNLFLRYFDRIDKVDNTIVDMKLSREFKAVEAYTGVTNLFDREYYETGSVLMPDRWITAGVKISYSGKP